MVSLLVGAWEVRDEDPEGLRGIFVFTEKHYAHMVERKDRMKGFKGEQPTEAEEAEAYRTMGAGGGSYTVSGNTMTLNEEFDRVPDHHAVSVEFAVAGDTLTMRELGGAWDIVFARVS